MTIVVFRYRDGSERAMQSAHEAAKSLPAGIVPIVVSDDVAVDISHPPTSLGSYAGTLSELVPGEPLKPIASGDDVARMVDERLRALANGAVVSFPDVPRAAVENEIAG